MKKYFFLIAGVLFATATTADNNADMVSDMSESTSDASSSANEMEWKNNTVKVYHPFGKLNMELDASIVGENGHQHYTSDSGFGASIGHTFGIGKPIDDKLRFGVEATWFDFCYTHYTNDVNKNYTYGKMDFSTGVGLSATYQPVNNLYIKGYAQYHLAMIGMAGTEHDENKDIMDEWSSFHFMFQGFGVGGVSVAYKCIGAGIEYRYGGLNSLNFFSWSITGGDYHDWRAYVQFTF